MNGIKKLTLTGVVIVMLFCSNAIAGNLRSWTFGDNQYVGSRLGFALTDNAEAGVESLWWPSDDTPQVWGAYGIYKWNDLIEISNPISADFLPEKFEAQPYLGARIGVNLDTDGAYSGVIAGLIIQEILFVEYQYTDFGWQLEDSLGGDDSNLVLGIRVKF